MRIKKPEFSIGLFVFLAEREGFEPSEEVSPLTRLAGERLQPTRPPLRLQLETLAKRPLLPNSCVRLKF